MNTEFQQGHALIIGVGQNLPNTVDDAEGLSEILRDPGRCAYPESQVHVLTESQATRDSILSALHQLAQDTSSDATVVFYFSGHGYQVSTSIGEAYYLIPYGYNLNQLNKTAISGSELTNNLSAIPAQKMLILLDCCHAGGLDVTKAPGLQLTKSPLPPEANILLAQGGGRVIIGSSQSNEFSYAGKPYSAFTLALIEALAGRGASKQDGFVRVADLALYAREMVPKRTKDQQHPVLSFEQADNFIVAYYAGGDTQTKALPFAAQPQIEAEPGAFTTSRIGDDIRVGDITSSTGIAIGRNSKVNVVTNVPPRGSGADRGADPPPQGGANLPSSEEESDKGPRGG